MCAYMVSPASPSHVVIAFDATKERGVHEFKHTFDQIRLAGNVLRRGDTLVVLGVLHKVPSPLGYQVKVCPDSFVGASPRAIQEEVKRKVDAYVNMLLQNAEVGDNEGVSLEVKITAGSPMKQVIFQEVVACKATWVILDRHFHWDLRLYIKQIPCKIALIQDQLSVEIIRPHSTDEIDNIEDKAFCSISRPVHPLSSQASESSGQSVITCKSNSLSSASSESCDMLKANFLPSSSSISLENDFPLGIVTHSKAVSKYPSTIQIAKKQHKNVSQQISSEAHILCSACEKRTELYLDTMRFSFSEIQLATNDFSKENLLGEGGYGHVYKGELRDGQLIAAKVHKEASTQGFSEFQSEVYVLSFACHKNIVMLLGFCCKENINILVYEYICNKSLEWHLFDKTAKILDWHQRYAVAIGTAKGLRFLHEECRGGPIVHRDMWPSNILLTHDFVPMLGDFGLARWKTGDPIQTRVLGTLGYLAPEYAENGVVSVKTDIYAFGIVLLQLVSGRKVVGTKGVDGQSLRQWAELLIEKLALHELIDCRLGESYDTYQLYLMAKAAYLCVQRSPEMRPSIGAVVRFLQGYNAHVHHMQEQYGLTLPGTCTEKYPFASKCPDSTLKLKSG